jgi:hypothetical protein
MYAAVSAARLRDIRGVSPQDLQIALVSPEPTPESSGAASKGGESAEPRKKVAPAPVKRRVVRGPDYGI